MQSVFAFVIPYRRETICEGIISGDSAGCFQKHPQDAGSPGLVGQVENTLACWLRHGEKVPGRRYF